MSYPEGVSPRDIPGWESGDVEKCLSNNADSDYCKYECGTIQRMECMKASHEDGKCWTECYYCEQKRLEAEYYEGNNKEDE